MKKLLVRADDLGYSEAVNYGIAKSVKCGIVKSVGIMTNMVAVQHGWDLVKDCNISFGQHTNICVGKPITDPKLIPSITNENGEFKTSKEYRNAEKDFVVFDEVMLEIEAQLKRFIELTGQKPAYFEGHAVSSANFFKALETVAEKHGLKYSGITFGDKLMRVGGSNVYMHMESMKPDYDPKAEIRKLIDNLHEDAVDVMILHPGYLDDYILKNSSLTTPRVLEVEMACDPEVKKWIENENINLTEYKEI